MIEQEGGGLYVVRHKRTSKAMVCYQTRIVPFTGESISSSRTSNGGCCVQIGTSSARLLNSRFKYLILIVWQVNVRVLQLLTILTWLNVFIQPRPRCETWSNFRVVDWSELVNTETILTMRRLTPQNLRLNDDRCNCTAR